MALNRKTRILTTAIPLLACALVVVNCGRTAKQTDQDRKEAESSKQSAKESGTGSVAEKQVSDTEGKPSSETIQAPPTTEGLPPCETSGKETASPKAALAASAATKALKGTWASTCLSAADANLIAPARPINTNPKSVSVILTIGDLEDKEKAAKGLKKVSMALREFSSEKCEAENQVSSHEYEGTIKFEALPGSAKHASPAGRWALKLIVDVKGPEAGKESVHGDAHLFADVVEADGKTSLHFGRPHACAMDPKADTHGTSIRWVSIDKAVTPAPSGSKK